MKIDKYTPSERKYIEVILVLLKISLDIGYWYLLKEVYPQIGILLLGYERGAFSFEFNLEKYICSWLVVIFVIKFLVYKLIKKDYVHELIIVGLIIISFMPTMTLFAMSNLQWSFFIKNIFFWGWFLYILNIITSIKIKDHIIKIKNKKFSQYIFYGVIVFFIIISLYLSYDYYGKIYVNLSFSNEDVYRTRSLARGKYGIFINYLRNNTLYVILPLVLNICLTRKRYVLFLTNFIFLLVVYSLDSQKAAILLSIVSIIASLTVKNKISYLIVKVMLITNTFIILTYYFFKKIILVEYLFKRVYFLPAIIGKCHYDYISQNENVIFFSSLMIKFGIISDYPYSKIPLPFLIGAKYFGSRNISANTGGFAAANDYGIIGLVIIPIVYSTLLKLLTIYSIDLKEKYIISVIVVYTFMINGATLTSVLLVYGLLLTLLLLSLMNNINYYKKKKGV